MNTFQPYRQGGAVLLIALIMLLVLTVLAVSSMRGVTLESRITGNRASALQMQNASDAALREAEFRYYNPYNLREKLEPDQANCTLANKLVEAANKPCLLAIKETNLNEFFLNPLSLTPDHLEVESEGSLLWMPYRGLDHAQAYPDSDYPVGEKPEWNTYLIGSPNIEYGAQGEGNGTFYYLANGKSGKENQEVASQSTFANVYVGLNN